MLVKQVSVYVENTTGRLAELTHILAEKGIDFRACNIAETVDFGILRFIVPDPQEAVRLLKEHGFIGGNVAISHCDNLALAQTLKNSILDIWENTSIEILPTRGLCSYYAERGGLIVSY